jgi:serine O-acetyltransferase
MHWIRKCELAFENAFSLSANRIAANIYYLSHRLYRYRMPFLPFLLQRLNAWIHGIEIDYRAAIGRNLHINHSQGIVIGEHVRMGDDCVLYSGVVLGVRHRKAGTQPKVGRGVLIGSGAKVLGPVEIGDYAVIGANSVVLQSVPAGVTCAGNPAQIVKVNDEGAVVFS